MFQDAINSESSHIADASYRNLVTIPEWESKGLDRDGASRKLNDSNWCFALRIRGLSYYAVGHTEEALADMKSALERCKTTGWDGDPPKASFYMAAILYDLGRFDEALDYVNEALRRDGTSPTHTELKRDIIAAQTLAKTTR